jgi:predicted enzyme related to lactoylglutathione lyase
LANVVDFEVGAGDPAAAAAFYANVFGWVIDQADERSGYWYITTGDEDDPGIAGGLTRRFDDLTSTVNTIEVPSLDVIARRIAEGGRKVLTPKAQIPGEGGGQYCADLESNTFAIVQYDESIE